MLYTPLYMLSNKDEQIFFDVYGHLLHSWLHYLSMQISCENEENVL